MELHLTTPDGFRFKVEKLPDDPMTNRLSIGVSKEDGCYIVFRGDTDVCLSVLEQALIAMRKSAQANKTQNN